MSLDIETLKKEAVPGETVLIEIGTGIEFEYVGIKDFYLVIWRNDDKVKNQGVEYRCPSAFKIKKETPKLYEWAFENLNHRWDIYKTLLTEEDAEKVIQNSGYYLAKKKIREIVID